MNNFDDCNLLDFMIQALRGEEDAVNKYFQMEKNKLKNKGDIMNERFGYGNYRLFNKPTYCFHNTKEYIPFLGGRPEREKLINSDDLLNLTIALNTSASLDDFLGKV